jgi:hypothetical protein
MNERIYDVHWEGPHNFEELSSKSFDENLVLYAIYGTHPIYGRNVLLYIGTTDSLISTRLSQHAWWVEGEPDPCGVYMASIGGFTNWQAWEEIPKYKRMRSEITKKVEALLIYAHQPVYNQRSKRSAMASKGMRIFNTGHRGTLLGEVSALYYVGE